MAVSATPTTVKGATLAPGMIFKARGRWYRFICVISVNAERGYRVVTGQPARIGGEPGPFGGKALLIRDDEDYPVQAPVVPKLVRQDDGIYLYRGYRIERANPAGPFYPWLVTEPNGQTADLPRLKDAVRHVDLTEAEQAEAQRGGKDDEEA